MLLELGRHAEGATLDQLARSVTGSKPTVLRALAALVHAGLAERAVGLRSQRHDQRARSRR